MEEKNSFGTPKQFYTQQERREKVNITFKLKQTIKGVTRDENLWKFNDIKDYEANVDLF